MLYETELLVAHSSFLLFLILNRFCKLLIKAFKYYTKESKHTSRGNYFYHFCNILTGLLGDKMSFLGGVIKIDYSTLHRLSKCLQVSQSCSSQIICVRHIKTLPSRKEKASKRQPNTTKQDTIKTRQKPSYRG